MSASRRAAQLVNPSLSRLLTLFDSSRSYARRYAEEEPRGCKRACRCATSLRQRGAWRSAGIPLPVACYRPPPGQAALPTKPQAAASSVRP